MKLDEAFQKYDDHTRLIRTSFKNTYLNSDPNADPKDLEDFIKRGYGSYEIKELKEMSDMVYCVSKGIPFMIPKSYIEDVNANDWEVVS